MKNHYYLFLLFSISVFTHAQELDFIQYSDISSIPQIVLNPKIQTELQTLLKHDYLKFQSAKYKIPLFSKISLLLNLQFSIFELRVSFSINN